MEPPTSLEDLFERFESLPSQDAEAAKGELVDRMLTTIARRLAEAGDDGRYRAVRDATARLRMLAPGADAFDDAVLQMIDAVREAFDGGPIADVVPVRRPESERSPGQDDAVAEASEGSFPASDAPGFVADGDGSR